MRCTRSHCDRPATRQIALCNDEANIYLLRDVCEPCADELCAAEPVAGATGRDGRVPLWGTKLQAIDLAPTEQ